MQQEQHWFHEPIEDRKMNFGRTHPAFRHKIEFCCRPRDIRASVEARGNIVPMPGCSEVCDEHLPSYLELPNRTSHIWMVHCCRLLEALECQSRRALLPSLRKEANGLALIVRSSDGQVPG